MLVVAGLVSGFFVTATELKNIAECRKSMRANAEQSGLAVDQYISSHKNELAQCVNTRASISGK